MSESVSLMFPGQGSQFVGMGKAFFDEFPAARQKFEKANEVLGYDLARTLFEGPEDEVNSTRICQPGILVTSLAILAVLREKSSFGELEFGPTLGLSLGEYSALVFAGALGFEDAVSLVSKRGQYMQECSDREESGMLSLMGTDEEGAAKLCEGIQDRGVLGIANLNSPGQVVISGAKAALEEAASRARDFGIRRAIPLKVAGAFHSELMDEAAQRLSADLATIEFQTPEIPIISNVTATPTTDPEEIRSNLGKQVKAPVLFQKSIAKCSELGVTRFVEPGPNRVLSGLLSKIDRSLESISIDSPEDLAKIGA